MKIIVKVFAKIWLMLCDCFKYISWMLKQLNLCYTQTCFESRRCSKSNFQQEIYDNDLNCCLACVAASEPIRGRLFCWSLNDEKYFHCRRFKSGVLLWLLAYLLLLVRAPYECKTLNYVPIHGGMRRLAFTTSPTMIEEPARVLMLTSAKRSE